MQKIVLFSFVLLLLVSNSCSNKRAETLPESSLCDFRGFVLPEGSYENDDNCMISFTYYDFDKCKKNADSIIRISVSEKSNIDSLFLALDNYNETQLNDSLETEKWTAVCMEIPNMPLNIFLKIVCNLQVREIRYWLPDFRYDEFVFFLSNKNKQDTRKLFRNFTEKEELEYLKNTDDNALKKIEDLTKDKDFRFSFELLSAQNPPKIIEAKSVANFRWNNKTASQTQLDSLDNLISDFKNKYQQKQTNDATTCNRKALTIHFAENIPLIAILRIINISRKYELLYEVDYRKNKLTIYTICIGDDIHYF